MYEDIAIRKYAKRIEERSQLNRKRIEADLTMTEIAKEAGVALASVSNFFKANINSKNIENTTKRLLGIK
ncbi:MAG: hypothetical protein AB7E96_12170 [Deferribacterales bacterium]